MAPGNRAGYPFSGLLFCGVCGAPMIVSGGSSAAYIVCGDAKKRGTCSNRRSAREDRTRLAILGALREALLTPSAIDYLRKCIAARLGDLERTTNLELSERTQRLARTDQRIRGLVEFVAQGDHSETVRATLQDLEVQAKMERAAIESLKDRLRGPVALPRPDDVLARATEFDATLRSDPHRARESLRRMFLDGRIVMTPSDDGGYEARGTLLPLVALGRPDEVGRPRRAPAAQPLSTGDDDVRLELAAKIQAPRRASSERPSR